MHMADTNYLAAATSPDEGVPFIDFLARRVERLGLSTTVTSNRRTDLLAFIQQYDHLRDEKRDDGDAAPPTPDEYAERWNVSRRAAFAIYASCREVLGEEPDAVVDVLWDGAGELVPLMRVRVVVDAG